MADNSFKIKNSLVLTPVDLATLTNPQAGDLACDINDSNKIKRYDANSSAWTEVGSGGVGSVDIMFVQDFESASLATFESPTDVTLSTTDPLHGKVSALLTHDASVNKSFKQIIPVDRKFRGQAMVLDLNVKSAASAGNVTIKITDETGSVDLIASEQLQLSNDVSGRRSSVSFTIPSTCASLSYTITALPEAGSPVTRIDDIVAMLSDVSLLETSVEVSVVTSWTSYTPTFQGFGSPTNIEFEWRQIGENVEIRGKFTSGSTTVAEARIGLPVGLTSAGTTLIPSITSSGIYVRNNAGAAAASKGGMVLIEPSVTYMTLGTPDTISSTSANWINKISSTSTVISLNDQISITASVPCAGLSATTTKTIPLTQSGLVQEGDSYLKVQQILGNGSTNTFVRRFSNVLESIGSNFTYTPSATLGDSITVNESGIYNIEYTETSSTSAAAFAIIKNYSTNTTPTSIPVANRLVLNYTENAADYANTAAWSGYLQAGDVIRFFSSNSGVSLVAVSGQFTITRQGSLKQVSVSSDQKITIPTSELRFEGASARGTGTETGIVQFTSLAKLRGDAFTVSNSNGTAITMTKAGKLDISTSLDVNALGNWVAITKNQQNRTTTPLSSEILSADYGDVGSASWSGYVNTGDIIRVFSTNGAPTSGVFNNLNLSFQEQDISVSVTNTLPQFSESDSSVRVDTANGYGSTYTKIRRFQTVRENLGTDVEYSDSATLGATFTIKSSGVYSISFTDEFTLAANMGITLNASAAQCATNFQSLPNDVRLAGDVTAGANYAACATWSGYLQKDDVIRAHTDGSGVGGLARTLFTISKVGKPNVTGVDVTPFVNVPQPDVASYSVINSPNGFGSTYTQNPRFLSIQQNDGSGILSYTDSATLGAYWSANKKCIATISLNSIYLAAAAWSFRIFKNQTGVNTGTGLTTIDDQANTRAGATISVELNVGDRISFYYSSTSMNRTEEHVFITATSTSDQILTAPETFSTDTASLTYAGSGTYTLTTLSDAPVGTYITFTYAANTNTRTQTTTPPSQSPADMNANGIRIWTRAYNQSSGAATDIACYAIQIGKGLKGKSLDLYKSAGKVTSGNLDAVVISSTTEQGIYFNSYNESTGVLVLDVGATFNSTTTSKSFAFTDLTSQTSGYLVINASKNPALTGLGFGSVVKAKYTSNSGQAVGTSATLLTMEDSVYDSNNAYTSGVYTVPENGTYIITANWVTAAVAISASTGSMSILIYVDGVLASNSFIRATGNTLAHLASITDQFVLRKGQTISIYGACSTATTMASGSFSITKFSVVKDS